MQTHLGLLPHLERGIFRENAEFVRIIVVGDFHLCLRSDRLLEAIGAADAESVDATFCEIESDTNLARSGIGCCLEFRIFHFGVGRGEALLPR